MKIVPDQIAKWVPGGLTTLGTGFGRSDTRPRLRRFFEIDAECVVVATLAALANAAPSSRHWRRAPSKSWMSILTKHFRKLWLFN